MRTDDLIATLGASAAPVDAGRLTRGVAGALALGAALAAMALLAFWGIRPDAEAIVQDPFLFAKTALPLLLGCLALPVGLASARPGGRTPAAAALWILPILLGALIIAALAVTPQAEWRTAFQGHSILVCLPSIPVLSAPILGALLFALRRGAPTHPARCGAVAGLVAGGLAAAIYSLFCVEDSPLFYGVWYTLAMGGVVIVGASLGRWLLRW